MYNMNQMYPQQYYGNNPMYSWSNMYNAYRMVACPFFPDMRAANQGYMPLAPNQYMPYPQKGQNEPVLIKDYGPDPFVIDINQASIQNDTYRTALWTGEHLQVTLMSLNPGEDIGLEVHPDLDQFIRIEQGQGLVKMGDSEYNLDFQEEVYDDSAFVIPAGKWHNLYNTGNSPLKLYSIYAPPQHPYGTVHVTKEDAMAAEHS